MGRQPIDRVALTMVELPDPPLPPPRSIGWTILLVAPLLLLTLPIILPIVAFTGWLDRRHRRTAARVTTCGRCGTLLGEDALARADAAWAAHMEKLFREHPGVRFRIVRTLAALCGVCGARSRWDEAGRTFLPEEG